MLKPSRERIAHMARLLLDEMDRSGAVRLLKDREAVRQSIAHALSDEIKQDEERYTNVLSRLASMGDAPEAGSREWESAVKRLMEEEYERAGFDSA
jgi:hypothetical protein